MDLQKVRKRLGKGRQATTVDFAKDVRFIFENSKKYNQDKTSKISKMAFRLLNLFEEQFCQIPATYGDRKAAGQSNKNKWMGSYSAD